MKYFLHDSSSFEDEKITELFIKFGYEGLGLFYTILEKLAKQEKPVKTEVLKHQLKIGKRLNKCWKFMEEIELISSNNGETFNEQLLNFSEKYQIKKQKNAKRISEWRKNQEDKKNVTRYESVSNASKVKESKVKESKINKISPENFQLFSQVVSYFDSKFYKENKWIDVYDKLIRIDGYSEQEILSIVKEFRSDGNWWKDNANFETLVKLRQKNKDDIKYIDLFKQKMKNYNGPAQITINDVN